MPRSSKQAAILIEKYLAVVLFAVPKTSQKLHDCVVVAHIPAAFGYVNKV